MVESMSWEEFIAKFKREFLLTIEVQQLAREYLILEKNSEMVAEINVKFSTIAYFSLNMRK